MYIYIQSLFSKPLLSLTIEINVNESVKRKNSSTDNNKTNDLLILFCKLSVLNTVSLLSAP